MRSLRVPLLSLLPLLIVLAPPVLAQEASPPPEPDGHLEELMREAEKYRGLPARRPVPSSVLGEEELKQKVVEAFREEVPPEVLRSAETSLKAFGFIPETMDLARFYPDLLTSQVAGFYDPARDYLALVRREGGFLGPAGDAGEEKDLEDMVLVHELVHALQDQHFDLEKFASDGSLSDGATARTALVEGDATLAMFSYLMKADIATTPEFANVMAEWMGDPSALMERAPDMPGTAELANAPAWFRDTLLFSYFQGFAFCLDVRKVGGQKLLDHAFSTDPPRSSEQILHPEKWHAKRDDPVALAWPDLSGALPGARKLAEGEVGEAGLRTLLRKADKSLAAAAGWGGDRFVVYEKDGARLLAWITEWDSEADAREFQAAARSLGRDWRVERTGPRQPRRVVVLRGALKKPERAAVLTALAAVRAVPPANRPIDLAALGIGEKPPAAGKGTELEKLLESAEIQEMVQGFLAQERPPGQVSEDGRLYTNPGLGVSIRLPESRRDWTLTAAGGPSLVVASNPDGAVRVSVDHLSLPMTVDVESMGPMLAAGSAMALPGFEKLSAGVVESGGRKAYELHWEADRGGERLRGIQRFYGQGKDVLILGAITPRSRWKREERALLETFDTFVLVAPAPEPRPEGRDPEPR